MMKKLYFSFLFFLYFFQQSSFASVENSIVVKIDNQIITNFEIKNKIISTLILSNQELNQTNINSLKKQTLETLIQLKLKIIELSNYDFVATDTEINQYLNSISSNNIESLEKKFIDYDLDYNLFLKEIETEFKWKKFIIKKYSKKINIDQNQIDFELDNLIKNNKNLEEYDLSEIEILIEEGDQIKKKIEKIEEEIKKNGFEKTAFNYSSSSTAAKEGKIGWVNSKSLSKDIFKILVKMKTGEVSDPIVRQNTVLYLKINDKRKNKIKNENLTKIKNDILNKKKNELFELYSRSHISQIKNNSLIEYK